MAKNLTSFKKGNIPWNKGNKLRNEEKRKKTRKIYYQKNKKKINEIINKWRKKNKEKIKEKRKLWRINNKEHCTIWRKNWRKKNSERLKLKDKEYRIKYAFQRQAIQTLNNAILLRRMIRKSCIICNKSKSEGHHEDYSKPLDVIWLCSKHHHQLHYQKKRAGGEVSSL